MAEPQTTMVEDREASGDATCAATHDRETRPCEVADAAMFAMAGGLEVETPKVDHRASHVRRASQEPDAEVCGVSMVTRGEAPPVGVCLHGEEPAERVQRLLDLSLMKLSDGSSRLVRVSCGSSLGESLWSHAGWLDKLPDLTDREQERRWDAKMLERSTDIADVIGRALSKAEAALRALDEDDATERAA